jgi:hypothetical protein
MVHPGANGRRDPWRLKLDALNFRKKAPAADQTPDRPVGVPIDAARCVDSARNRDREVNLLLLAGICLALAFAAAAFAGVI